MRSRAEMFVMAACAVALLSSCTPSEPARPIASVGSAHAAPARPEEAEMPDADPRFVPTTIAGDGEYPVTRSLLWPGDELLIVERGYTHLEVFEVRTGRRLATSFEESSQRSPPHVGADGLRVVWRGFGLRIPTLEYDGELYHSTRSDPPPPPLDDETRERLERYGKRHRFQPIIHPRHGNWMIGTPRIDPGHADLAADGRHVWTESGSSVELLQTPTGRVGRFAAWTTDVRGLERPSPREKPRFAFGPTLDRFVVTSLVEGEVGPTEAGIPWPPRDEAKLVDATTMRPIAKLHASCHEDPTVWSPSGRWILRNDCRTRGTVVHDAKTGGVVRAEGSSGWSFASDDATIVAEGSLFDVETGKRRFVVPAARRATLAELTPDGRALVVIRDGRITRWDLGDGSHHAVETRWETFREPSTDAALRHAWRRSPAGGFDVVDLESLAVRHLPGEVGDVEARGSVLLQIAGSAPHVVDAKGALVGTLGAPSRSNTTRPTAVTLAEGGAWAALGRDDGSVDIFDVRASRRVATVPPPTVDTRGLEEVGGKDEVLALSFRDDGSQLAMVRATVANTRQIAMVDTKSGRVLHRRTERMWSARLAWTRDRANLLIASSDGLVAFASDLSGFAIEVAKGRGYGEGNRVGRLAATYPDLASLQAGIDDPAPDTAGFDDFAYDAHRRFGVRTSKVGVEVLRVEDGARVRLDSAEILTADGGIAIAPDGTFDVTSPDLEPALRLNDRALTSEELASRRRPGLLATFVGASHDGRGR